MTERTMRLLIKVLSKLKKQDKAVIKSFEKRYKSFKLHKDYINAIIFTYFELLKNKDSKGLKNDLKEWINNLIKDCLVHYDLEKESKLLDKLSDEKELVYKVQKKLEDLLNNLKVERLREKLLEKYEWIKEVNVEEISSLLEENASLQFSLVAEEQRILTNLIGSLDGSGELYSKDMEVKVEQLSGIIYQLEKLLIEEKRKIIDPLYSILARCLFNIKKEKITREDVLEDIEAMVDHLDAINYLNALLSLNVDRSILKYAQRLAKEAEKNARNEVESLEQQVILDSFTRLYNKAYFNIMLQKFTKKAIETNSPLSLITIDIDNFKIVNDLYGHTVGDDVIKGLVEKIKQTVRRKQDLPCRYGGEEFFILLPYVNLEGAKKIAENIKKGFKELKFEVERYAQPPENSTIKILEENNKYYIGVTISIGIAEYNNELPLEFVKKADEFLIKAKNIGKDCIVTQ
ncbi:GGDEF domain-containing protein [Candidatus Woesearchaeota archaeon]|nr:GGDEF domain-containing protein [Candidatus Woesearchaeota archaeon]